MNRTILSLVLVLLPALSAADLPTHPELDSAAVEAIVGGMHAHAAENKWNVCVAILDDGGHLLYFERMDGVQLGSIEVSMRKAESALKFRRSTAAFADRIAAQPQVMSLPGAFSFEGGLPIEVDGHVVGAIGVSGVTAQQDGMIAKAGLDALARYLN